MEAAVARIIDANFNRAREALRVMEDFGRFVLDDTVLCERLKRLRHDLCAAMNAPALRNIISSRDTAGDVGTTVTAEGEYERASAGDVAAAAGKRLSEALRVLEEYGKTASATLAGEIERIRYRGYDIEKRLTHTIGARARFGAVRLYVLVTEALCARPWRDVVKAASEGGAECFQLREKAMTDAELLNRACAFCELCHSLGTLCIINDRADIAVASGADGVHVGQYDISIRAARAVVGPGRIVGASSHSVEEATAAAEQCPDYVAVGPMFATALKPDYGVAGPELLRAVRAQTALPLVAIGGITADNVADVVEAGGRCMSVCSAIIAADDPAQAARRVRAHLQIEKRSGSR
jgi:thiamine-phosphate pyrophosphorylase